MSTPNLTTGLDSNMPPRESTPGQQIEHKMRTRKGKKNETSTTTQEVTLNIEMRKGGGTQSNDLDSVVNTAASVPNNEQYGTPNRGEGEVRRESGDKTTDEMFGETEQGDGNVHNGAITDLGLVIFKYTQSGRVW
ncbi:hypothetical protein DFH28DRAFT_939508 [Melampsora americana]|nr:hypothetical protein DFH28DRAFT_939508 [Melampsora americana]